VRTRNGNQNNKRQHGHLLVSQSPFLVNLPATPASQCVTLSTVSTPQSMLGHSTPVSFPSQPTRPPTLCLTQSGDAPLQILVPDNRLNPGPLSPTRRKCDSPRRRGGGQLGAPGTSRASVLASSLIVESQSEETVTENLSQIVIENAREKILNDRSLQEKLAENINKILASDNSPQTSKAPCSTVEQEQSIDEILGLQGEIHMTDDAIQDILAQTESDPAFQALFDLFDNGPGQECLPSGQSTTQNILIASELNKKKPAVLPKTPPVTLQHQSPAKQTEQTPTISKRELAKPRGSASQKDKADRRPSDHSMTSSQLTEKVISMDIDGPESDSVIIQTEQLVPLDGLQSPQSSSQAPVANKAPQTMSIPETVKDACTPARVSELKENKETSPSLQSEVQVSHCPPQSVKETCTKTISPSKTSLHTQLSTVAVSAPTTIASSTSACATDPQAKEPDPSNLVSLKIIIRDEHDADEALNQAVSSISSECIPTIVLSSPVKSPAKPITTSVITQEETAQAVSCLPGVQGMGSLTPARSVQSNGQAVVARPTGQETGFFQLLQPNTTFGPSGGYYVVTDSSTTEQSSNVVLLPNKLPHGTISALPQMVAATPPRQRTLMSMGAKVSQSYSPGSTIIISSPVQPMLQNVMLPVSVMGQNTGKLTVLPNQMLTLPCSATLRQPTKVNAQPKLAPIGTTDTDVMAKSVSLQASKVLPQTSEQDKSMSSSSPSHRRILCFDVTPENTAAVLTSSQTSTLGSSATTTSIQQKPTTLTESKPTESSVISKRRLETTRVSEISPSSTKDSFTKITIFHQQNETQKNRVNEKRLNLFENNKLSSKGLSEPETRSDSQKNSAAKESGGASKSSSRGPKQKSTGNFKNSTDGETCEKPVEKNSLQDSPGITANKENEMESCRPSACSTEDLASAKFAAPVSNTSSKTSSKTAPLTKQAAEMLQDIQSQAPTNTPLKRPEVTCPDLPLPRTPGAGCAQDELTDGLRTPSRQRLRREGETTPRHLPLPATPDIPSCSPASEAGSENSINMAAHTLMILSRAARTGAPLKDSRRQEEARGGKTPIPTKGKKRKQTESSPLAKKELHLSRSSSSKKKSKKQKKLLDSFPDDLDVDKFLSSLHYDE
ncbi:hypothetical protein DNTS_030037, partial [Danionella cerebrum]